MHNDDKQREFDQKARKAAVAGDVFYVHHRAPGNGNASPERLSAVSVERVTQTHIMTAGGRWNKSTGTRAGDNYGMSKLVPMTRERQSKYRRMQAEARFHQYLNELITKSRSPNLFKTDGMSTGTIHEMSENLKKVVDKLDQPY